MLEFKRISPEIEEKRVKPTVIRRRAVQPAVGGLYLLLFRAKFRVRKRNTEIELEGHAQVVWGLCTGTRRHHRNEDADIRNIGRKNWPIRRGRLELPRFRGRLRTWDFIG